MRQLTRQEAIARILPIVRERSDRSRYIQAAPDDFQHLDTSKELPTIPRRPHVLAEES